MKYRKAKIVITNDFHNTEKVLWARIPAGSDAVLITVSQAKACKRALCGVSGCSCSDDIGARPSKGQINPNATLVEVFAKPEKIMDGFYSAEWPDGTGRLVKD